VNKTISVKVTKDLNLIGINFEHHQFFVLFFCHVACRDLRVELYMHLTKSVRNAKKNI
jgi:hypothetical protein